MKKLFLVFIFTISLIQGYGQKTLNEETGESFILNQPLPGSQSYKYTASEYIKMIEENGTNFEYSPQPGQFFQATVDPLMVFPPEEGEYGGPSGNTVGNDGLVGNTNGLFSVNSVGLANYSIPLEFPGGSAGMTPDLSLIYNGSRQDGILGPGWSLTGLSVISQVPASRYFDGNRFAAFGGDYWSKAYTLDGDRLIRIDEGGTEVEIEFRKEKDDFSMVKRKTISATKEIDVFYFEVKTKGGLTYYYGETSESRLRFTFDNNTICVAYYVNRITDNFGNTIKFQYQNDNTDGEIYLDEITYTHHTDTDVGDYKIKFNYVDRNFTYSTYYNYQPENNVNHSVSFNSKKLIQSIECTNFTEGFVKKYQLEYIERGPGSELSSKNQYLSSIQEFGLIDEDNIQSKYNKTVFEWQNEMDYGTLNEVLINNYNYFPLEDMDQKYLVDIDNDNINELVYTESVENEPLIWLWISKFSNGSYHIGDSYLFFMAHNWEGETNHRLLFGDYNGDGKTEILLVAWLTDQLNTTTKIKLIEYLGVEQIHTEDVFSQTPAYRPYTADFNGDGISDLLLQNPNTNNASLVWRLGSAVNTLQSNIDGDLTYNPQYATSSTFEILDVNGDGRADILVNDELRKLKPDAASNSISFELVSFEKPINAILCNLNQDNKYDAIKAVISYGQIPCNENFDCEVNLSYFSGTGLGFEPKSESGQTLLFEDIEPPEFLQQYIECNIMGGAHIKEIGDLTGDGLSDFFLTINFTYEYYDDNYILIDSRSTSDNFILITSPCGFAVTCYNTSIENANDLIPMNFNGDNQTDLARFDESSNKIVINSPDQNGFRINRITTGLGVVTDIEYGFSSDPDIYTPGADVGFPVVPYELIQVLVKRVKRDDGQGGLFVEEYQYEKAMAHTEGLGYLGFQKTIRTDVTHGIKHITNYSINETYFFAYPQEQTMSLTDGSLIQRKSTVFNAKEFFSPINNKAYYYAYPELETIEYYELNQIEPYKRETIEFSYDNYGNPLTIINSKGYSETDMPFVTETQSTYDNFVDNDKWILGRLRTAQVTTSVFGEVDKVRESEFTYYGFEDGDLVGMLKEEIIEPNISTEKVIKTYTYDEYGNILTTTVSADGLESRISETQYTAGARFVKKLINPLLHESSRQYDPLLGVLLSETDEDNLLTTTHYYDGFGRLYKSILPDRKQSISVLRWVQPDDTFAPEYAIYYSWSQSSGVSPEWIYYNSLGKELRKVRLGFNGDPIFIDIQYNEKGQLSSKSEPYNPGSTIVKTKFENYDALGRIKKIVHPDNTSTDLTYDGLSTSTTNDFLQTNTKTLNAAGWLVDCVDANGERVKHTYFSNGLVKMTYVVDLDGSERNYSYDTRGNLIGYSDQSQGSLSWTYNAFGELTEETNPNGTTSYVEYDKLGRLREKISPEGTTTWSYDTNKKGMLDQVKLMDGNTLIHQVDYAYDDKLRPELVTENITGEEFVQSFDYDVYSRLKKKTYPSGFAIENRYNQYGYKGKILEKETGKVIWEAKALNARDQFTQVNLGSNIVQNMQYYYETGRISKITATGLQDNEYNWDNIGNLIYRKSISGIPEVFYYDNLNRLVEVDHNGILHTELDYDELGNITYKSDVGVYAYEDENNPYKLTSINNQPPTINSNTQSVIYNSFNKVTSITETVPGTGQLVKELNLIYGSDMQRIKQTMHEEGSQDITKYYVGGDFEKTIIDGEIRLTHYIYSPQGLAAIVNKSASGSKEINYVLTDHLGSVQVLVNETGALLEEYSYDPWGLRRNPVTLEVYAAAPGTNLDYGFTGHEHLDAFMLINMNGRMYDPVIGRFFSPDPVLQFPDYTQGLNPYSYALNNPLHFVDPSGYSLAGQLLAISVQIAFTMIGNPMLGVLAYSAVMTIDFAIENGRKVTNFSDLSSYFTQAFVMSAISMGGTNFIGATIDVMKKTVGRELLRALSHGAFNGTMRMTQGGKFEHGFFSGLVSSLGGSAINGQGMNAGTQIFLSAAIGGTAEKIGGGKFANGAVTGAYVMMFNHLNYQGANVEKILKKYFGQVDGLNEIYTDRIPDDYTLDQERKWFLNNENIPVAGATVYISDGKSDVYLSPYALENAFNLYEVLGHEMIHVAHHNYFLDNFNKGASEYAAYKWSYNVAKNLYGEKFAGEYYDRMFSYRHSALESYKYDKFGFSTGVPPSLWDW